ncbi:hypothetical protein PCANC_25920 [Puccinia coronata f. sp. avenae]|uniref:DDE Tnp4 domain-containing protein n=1 Tax=Puccinia coronata f. sp. avenae TaxID=200324 RepID=A0A2N5TJN3_9BASI|nr:hypothetical protein PCANC_25920 [Puccinia coronata f. sp. avenae]
MDNKLKILLQSALALIGIFLLSEMGDPEAYYSDGGRARYVHFLLEEARSDLFREVTALERDTFDALVKEFKQREMLKNGRSVTDFSLSNDSLVKLYPIYVKFSPPPAFLPKRLNNPKYQAFKNCLGALDGVFIPVTVPVDQQAPYRMRKGFFAQNVLAVVNFDFEFVFILAGWEGSDHDGTVLTDAFWKGFSIPGKKYYLANAGYALQKGILTPFQATCYHLKEQAIAGLRPSTAKELYNLRHSSLQNIVKRIFGCLKAKFKVLTTPSEHNIHQQVQLVYALVTLWNFLRRHKQLDDDEFLTSELDGGGNLDAEAEDEQNPHRRTHADDVAMASRRLRLSAKLWDQYNSYLSANPRSE